MTIEYEICVSSDLANLAGIASFVSERARLVGMGDDAVFAIQMAVDEACTNSIEHAYGGADKGQVRVCCYLEDQNFVVRITDYGEPFDPDAIPAPNTAAPLEEREIGGLGLFFMRKLMDSVEFVPAEPRGNLVIMRKHKG
jgi:serine/threonine-protein kinase RsbW